MKTYFMLLFNLFTVENKINISKKEVLLKYQYYCPNVKLKHVWANNTGFGLKNMFSTVNYYNNANEETAIVAFKKYNINFTLVDTKDNNVILKFSSNINNIFTRYIADIYTNIDKKSVNCDSKNIPDLFKHYYKWLLKYQT